MRNQHAAESLEARDLRGLTRTPRPPCPEVVDERGHHCLSVAFCITQPCRFPVSIVTFSRFTT